MAKKSYKRELIEWTIIVVVGLTLYFTGLHTEVIGQIQRIVLATGLITPDTEEESEKDASYNLTLTSLDGETVDFSTLKGQTIFMNVWATWCPPCIAEMPDIQNLYEATNDQVAFVMLSMDENPEKARAFIERKGFTFPVYFLTSGMPGVYRTTSIPSTFVIGPDGKIQYSRSGMAKYNTDDFRDFLLNLGG